jgi:hypothetical protein
LLGHLKVGGHIGAMGRRYIRLCQGRRGLVIAGILLSSLWLSSTVAGEAADQRYTPPDHAFSIIAPEGWEEKDMPGMKYKVFITQPAEKFAPNMAFVDEASSLSLKDYVDASRKLLAGTSTSFKELSLEPFTTEGSLQGYRLSFKNRYMEINLLQTQYYFSTPEKKLIVTCSMAENDKRPIFTQCDKSLKTFRAGDKK